MAVGKSEYSLTPSEAPEATILKLPNCELVINLLSHSLTTDRMIEPSSIFVILGPHESMRLQV